MTDRDADDQIAPDREKGPTMFPETPTMRPTLRGRHGLVVAGHPLAAQAAADVLAAGGNAVDAGVAAGLLLTVVHGDMCSLGGIAPLLVSEPDGGGTWSIGGVGTWSETASIDAYVERHGSSMTAGCAATIVPGALAAYCAALDQFGSMPFETVAEPAHAAAEDGFVMDPVVGAGYRLFGDVFRRWPSSVAAFWPDGHPPEVGRLFRQPDLARTFAALRAAGSATEAKRLFHEGEPAERMVDFVASQGGFLTTADLAGFEAEVTAAPSRRFRRRVVASTPFWSQGPMLLQSLAVLEHLDLASLPHNGGDHLHLVAEAVRLAASDREAFYGSESDVPSDWLLSDERGAELAARIDRQRALADLPMVRAEQPGTTHFTVIDAAGRVCTGAPSDTASLAPVVPGLGFIVSARGVQSRLDPAHPAALGPGRRPRVSPAAAIAFDDDGTITGLACPGADVIVQAMLQVALNVWEFGLEPQAAVERPRICSLGFPASFPPHDHLDRQLCVERRIDESVRVDLERRGHRVQDWPAWEFDAGSVSIVQYHPDRTLSAGADPRRAAYAAGR